MIEVKIPKLFTIEKQHILEHLDAFINDEILANLEDADCMNMSYDQLYDRYLNYFWGRIKGNSCVKFTHKWLYDELMDYGKRKFKDSEYVKYDWVVFIDFIQDTLYRVGMWMMYPYFWGKVTAHEDICNLTYTLMFEELTGENTQKYLNP